MARDQYLHLSAGAAFEFLDLMGELVADPYRRLREPSLDSRGHDAPLTTLPLGGCALVTVQPYEIAETIYVLRIQLLG